MEEIAVEALFRFLKEDVVFEDITSEAIVPRACVVRAAIVAEEGA